MILVTGLDFSGTSATAGILYHLGLDFGVQVDTEGDAFPVLPWPTYECLPLTVGLASVVSAPGLTKEGLQACTRRALAAESFRGAVKSNFPCVLGERPAGVSCLITTQRDEGQRQKSVEYYLGMHAMHPSIRRVDTWMRDGHTGILHAADCVVDFRDVYEDPWYVIWGLIDITGVHASRAQIAAAAESLRGRQTNWPLELHHA